MNKYFLAVCLMLQAFTAHSSSTITIAALPCVKIAPFNNGPDWTLMCIMTEQENRTYLLNRPTDDKFLQEAYMMLLYRYPDEGGFSWWMSQLAAGATRNQVLDAFIASPEYKNLHT